MVNGHRVLFGLGCSFDTPTNMTTRSPKLMEAINEQRSLLKEKRSDHEKLVRKHEVNLRAVCSQAFRETDSKFHSDSQKGNRNVVTVWSVRSILQEEAQSLAKRHETDALQLATEQKLEMETLQMHARFPSLYQSDGFTILHDQLKLFEKHKVRNLRCAFFE